jgi:hypothetical protein
MAVTRRVRGPHNRDCEIVVSEPVDATAPAKATCVDVPTRTVMGSCSIPRASSEGLETTPDDVIRMVGGAYRLASIAVDIETDLLGRRSRRVSDLLRLRRRLWRRWSRVVRHLDSATGPNAAAEKMREAP